MKVIIMQSIKHYWVQTNLCSKVKSLFLCLNKTVFSFLYFLAALIISRKQKCYTSTIVLINFISSLLCSSIQIFKVCKYKTQYLIHSVIFFLLILFHLTLQYCIDFAIYQNESATGIHVFPILSPPPSSLPIPSLWVFPVYQPQASSIMHRTWTGDSFHI